MKTSKTSKNLTVRLVVKEIIERYTNHSSDNK